MRSYDFLFYFILRNYKGVPFGYEYPIEVGASSRNLALRLACQSAVDYVADYHDRSLIESFSVTCMEKLDA